MEQSTFVLLKFLKGDITLRQLQAEMKEDGATNDDITKGVWKWLQHNKQD